MKICGFKLSVSPGVFDPEVFALEPSRMFQAMPTGPGVSFLDTGAGDGLFSMMLLAQDATRSMLLKSYLQESRMSRLMRQDMAMTSR